jgi:hypothetical protein
MKTTIAVLLNVLFSVGAMCLLVILGVSFWFAFALFLVVFIPGANFVVAKITGVDCAELVF